MYHIGNKCRNGHQWKMPTGTYLIIYEAMPYFNKRIMNFYVIYRLFF